MTAIAARPDRAPGMPVVAATPQYPKRDEDDAAEFGVFVRNEDEELDLEEVVEPWHKYDDKKTPHVYYPILLGEVINGRYLVEHKVGSGGFATVWMAHDLQDKKDVALKIMSSGEWGDIETRIQDEILQRVQDTSHLVTYLATFLLPGNNCYHRVLVLPLMGPPLCQLTIRNISMATRMSAAKQLLVALGNLHKAGIIHRDLNERNCMWGMVPLHNLSRNKKYEALGRPLKRLIPFIDDLWRKGELVQPINVPENLRADEFYLGDFGLAMKIGDPIYQHGGPPERFCSPDRLHKKGLTTACDMWSYMVLFSLLYLGSPPFPTIFRGGIIAGIVCRLGPLPEKWKGLYIYPGALDSWYDQHTTVNPERGLESVIAYHRPESDPVERKHILSIMSRVFTYCPEKRPSAAELLRDPSFRAIMDKYGS
ncbi:hypothetical protein MferCBS31731_006921 [Microsporum ferrugineum]